MSRKLNLRRVKVHQRWRLAAEREWEIQQQAAKWQRETDFMLAQSGDVEARDRMVKRILADVLNPVLAA